MNTRPARNAAPRRAAAFTMIEIMIVLAIIAIVITAGVPTMWRAMQKNDLSRAVNDVMEGCKLARDRAILQGIPYEFVLSAEGEMKIAPARVRDINPASEATPAPAIVADTLEEAPKPVDPPSTSFSGFPRKLGEDVMIQLIDVNFVDQMDAPEARVRFFPTGTSDHFTVVLNFKGQQRTVDLDIVTGIPQELVVQ